MRSNNVIAIRSGTTDDLKMLADLGRRTFLGAYEADNDPDQIANYVEEAFAEEQIAREISQPESVFLIAEIGGEPVGYAKWHTGSAPDVVDGPNLLELERIYAEQSHVGQGVA